MNVVREDERKSRSGHSKPAFESMFMATHGRNLLTMKNSLLFDLNVLSSEARLRHSID